MRAVKGFAVMAALVGAMLVPSGAEAAEAVNCVDNYLLCINDASQESGAFWRTLKEAECGVDYYACIKNKVAA